MPINDSGYFSDTLNKEVLSGAITVGTSAVEAKVGGSRQEQRQLLRIYNSSASTIYIGPSGVTTATGEPLEKKQWATIPAGSALGVFVIAATAGNSVIIQEWA